MMTRFMFPHDVISEMNRLQRQIQNALDAQPDIRGFGRGGFPALNIGRTPQSIELFAFVPGLDPSTIDVNFDRAVLTIAGERADNLSTKEQSAAVHVNERFEGQFRRVVSLPDDVDPDSVAAKYQNGVLRISVKRRESVQPRRISIH